MNFGLKREIDSIIDNAKKSGTESNKGQKATDAVQNRILALKAKHELDKKTFESQISTLQEKLKEREDSELDRTKARSDMGKAAATAGATEFANPVALLKIRLQKWTINNKEKKHLMDMYIRNVKIIEDAFDQIKGETGIGSTEEIVTTFIKAEEQNYNLFNYVNTLNSDIDMIEE